MTDYLLTEFWQAIDQFNQGEFYGCHDTLEALWMEATEPEKKFYQGILQIAVALYHLENQNWRGAVILLGEGLYRLNNYQPEYGGINVTQFVTEAQELLVELQLIGAERVQEIILVHTNDAEGESVDRSAGPLRLPLIQRAAN